MNTFQIRELKAGMVFNYPVYIDEETLFLPAGIPVRDKDIERLEEWKVEEVISEGNPRKIDEFDNSSLYWGAPSNKELFEYYSDAIDRFDNVISRIENFEQVTKDEVIDFSMEVTRQIDQYKFDTARLILADGGRNKQFAKSCINCSILAFSIAKFMNVNEDKIPKIVYGAMLHDLGMLRVPGEITGKKGVLDSSERKTLKSHPLYSYQIMTKEMGFSDEESQSALQHHERWDGEGYPQGLKGEEIAFEARIISVADAFEAMVSERPYRESMIGYDAMKQILSDNGRRFDPEILKSFISSMGLYPIGSMVLLSDSSIGRVIGINKETPLRPEVLINIDKDGNEYQGDTGPTIDLRHNKSLFITKALDIKSFIDRKKT